MYHIPNHSTRKNTQDVYGLQGTTRLGNTLGNDCTITCYERTSVLQWTTWDNKDLVPPELGSLDALTVLSLDDNKLSGPIPPELSKLRRLRDLFVSNNAGISGRLPPELGYTGGLEYVSIGGTGLAGPVPLTFANLKLTHFYFERGDLCIPARLEAWLKTVPETEDDYSICTDQTTVDPRSLYFEAPPLGDTARLAAEVITAEGNTVQDATVTWSSADTTIAKVDSEGLVTAVDYGTTQVTATSDALTATAEVEVVLTLTDRQVLDSIHQLMGGENWTDSTNWLSDEPLSEWYGVETNAVGSVVGLSLANNGLAGPMPDLLAELGDLVTLDLSGNALTGEIPRELEGLAQLRTLVLNDTTNSRVGCPPPWAPWPHSGISTSGPTN